MRIEAINLSREVYESMGIGLPTLPMDEPLQLRDFGQCVVIAGKNGSGKTRLLTLLAGVARKYVTSEARRQAEFNIEQTLHAVQDYQAHIQRIETHGLRDGENPGHLDAHRARFLLREMFRVNNVDLDADRVRQL